MLKIEIHIKEFRHILSLCLVLLSLSPCTVKGALFHLVNMDYVKNINKSKTTLPITTCSYSQSNKLELVVVKKINKQIEPVNFVPSPLLFVVKSIGIHDNYSKLFSGNSPPRYILYKRLKINIV